MSQNKVITMFYELKDANSGDLLESNIENGGISFITGHGHIIEKLEEQVVQLNIGDKKEISIKSCDACGEYDSSMVQSLPKEQFAGIDLKEGMELFGQAEDNSSVRVIVKAIGENEVMVDFNHPYAGKDLLFNIEIAGVRDATEDEVATGMVGGAHSCGCGSHKDKSDHECCGGHGHHHDGEHECCGGHGHGDDDHECCGGHGHGEGHGHHHDGEHECCGKHKH